MNKIRENLNNQNIPSQYKIKESNKNNKKNQHKKSQPKNQNTTKIMDIIFILDRSGSMSGLEDDTIGGFNGMIKNQKNQNLNDEIYVTTVLFDNTIKMIHNRTPLKDVKDLTSKDYFVGGSTALFDAIGYTINSNKNSQKNKRADSTIMIITTDGYENSSREYNFSQIKNLINERKNKNWEFIFLGANIDSEEFSNKIGIDRDNAINYSASSKGTQVMYSEMADCMTAIRQRNISNKQSSNFSVKDSFKKSKEICNK